MALTPIQSAKAQGTTTTISPVLGTTPTTNNYLVVHISLGVNSGISTISTVRDSNSNSLTQIDIATEGSGGGQQTAIYWYQVPATPSTTITVTRTAGGADMAVVVQEWPGSSNQTPGLNGTVRAHGHTIGINTTLTFPSVSWSGGDVAVALYGDNGASTPDNIGALNSFTIDTNNYNNSSVIDCVPAYLDFTSGATIPNAFTVSSGSGTGWGIVYAALEGTTTAVPNIKPIVVTNYLKRKGNIFNRPTPPTFVAQNIVPIVSTRPVRRQSNIIALKFPPVPAPPTIKQLPVTETTRVHRQEFIHLLNPPTPVTLTALPIVHTNIVRRRGLIGLLPVRQPVIIHTQSPVVTTTRFRRLGSIINFPKAQPFVLPPQTARPIVQTTQVRRRSRITLIRPFTTPFKPPTPIPLVQTSRVRRIGRAILAQIIFKAPPPPPSVTQGCVIVTDTAITGVTLSDSPVTTLALTDQAC